MTMKAVDTQLGVRAEEVVVVRGEGADTSDPPSDR